MATKNVDLSIKAGAIVDELGTLHFTLHRLVEGDAISLSVLAPMWMQKLAVQEEGCRGKQCIPRLQH